MMSPAFSGEALSRVEAPWVAHRVWPRTRRAVRRLLRNWWCPGRWVLNAPRVVRIRHRPSVCSRTASVCGSRGDRARLCRVAMPAESTPRSSARQPRSQTSDLCCATCFLVLQTVIRLHYLAYILCNRLTDNLSRFDYVTD